MKKRILFAVRNMNIGGVEKSLLSLLNTLDPSDYDVDLLLLENQGGFLEDVPAWVRVVVFDDYLKIRDELNLPPLSVIKNLIKSRRFLRAVRLSTGFFCYKISKNILHYYKSVFRGTKIPGLKDHYDIAVSYTSLIVYLSYTVLNYVKADSYFGWIHFDVSKLALERKSQYLIHSKCEKIYLVSNEALDSFVKMFPELSEKCELKYNVIDSKAIYKSAEELAEKLGESGETVIITLGRLSKEKGQDIIPEICRDLKNAGLKFKWVLIGDGNLRPTLEQKIKEYGLRSEIKLLGTKKNPYPYLKQADVYVQTSVHEGYCITLAEAKCFDPYIISTKFAGAQEQLAGYEKGVVVERDKNQMKDAIIKAIPHNYGVRIAKQDFSSGCTNKLR